MTKVHMREQGDMSNYNAAISTAMSLLNSVADAIDEDNPLDIKTGIAFAQAEAAIAQAEQLKRIADMMEEDRRKAKMDSDARAFAAQVKSGR